MQTTDPIYQQVQHLISSWIDNKQYHPGMPLPSENELAQQLNINRLTVRTALKQLIQDGKIKTVHGKGSFVLGKQLVRDLNRLEGFSQTMLNKNLNHSVKILKNEKRIAGIFYGKIFSIKENDSINVIHRLCFVEEQPISLEKIIIPSYLIPNLTELNLSVFSLYQLYEFYGVNIKEANQTLEIVNIDKKESKLLNLNKENPVMMLECTSYDDSKNIVELSQNFTRSDHCHYMVHFTKKH